MIFYITFLRFLAALLITNSHFGAIYPRGSFACGGMLGNLLFFAVSGYCLYHVRGTFLRWYGQRLLRIYPAVAIVTLINLPYGALSDYLTWQRVIGLFFYPTYYHFIAAIVVLYIPFYFLMKIPDFRLLGVDKLAWLSFVVFTIYLTAYAFFFDKTAYHIENVGDGQMFPWFIYTGSMLLGAIFRKYDHYFRARRFCLVRDTFFTLLAAMGYVVVRSLLKTGKIPGEYQILSIIFLYLLTAAGFWSVSALDHALQRWRESNRWTGWVVEMISIRTLEVYLVQYMVIDFVLNRLKVSFPLNWLVCVSAILLAAVLVHWAATRAAAPLIRQLKRE